jgi:L-ascorbate metabolism protein UlaG (beta-lactamase superfamily)
MWNIKYVELFKGASIMAKLLFQGHGSLRLETNKGQIIYVDPCFGEGYEKPADLILITHGHGDHTKTKLVTKKENCKIFTFKEAINKKAFSKKALKANENLKENDKQLKNLQNDGKYNNFEIDGIKVEPVAAGGNLFHSKKKCVGFLIKFDGLTVYASGDTSKIEEMENLKNENIDYALLCGDGTFNMGPEEAALVAKIINSKHNILIHMVPGGIKLYDKEKVKNWIAPNKLDLAAGKEIELKK